VDKVTGGGSLDASLSHVPLLANVIVRYDKPDCKWVPYAGVAVGGDASVIALDHVRAPNGVVVDGSDSTLVFAWQVFGGVRYKFHPNMSIGAGYKFFSASSATWEVKRSSGDIETGTARVHSVGVDFSIKF
jgi:opacity protein-like surface antigen